MVDLLGSLLVFLPALLFVSAIVATGTVLHLRDGRKDRYKRMLENTSRLERELFPEWFKDENEVPYTSYARLGLTQDTSDWSFAPDAVWSVERGARVYNLAPASASASACSAALNYTQVIRRAEKARAAAVQVSSSKRAVENLLLFGPQFHG